MSARRRAAGIGAVVLVGILGAVAVLRHAGADDRCSTSSVFELPVQLSTPDGLRDQEGAHLIGRWPVDEGVLEIWLIAAEGKISEAFLTLSRRQLKRAAGALPKDIANCIKVMAALDPSNRRADATSWLVSPALAAIPESSYRIIRSCAAPTGKAKPRMCHYALERRENNVWKALAVYGAAIGG